MKPFVRNRVGFVLGASLLAGAFATQALANGAVGDHVNHLQDHLGQYEETVNWLAGKFGEDQNVLVTMTTTPSSNLTRVSNSCDDSLMGCCLMALD